MKTDKKKLLRIFWVKWDSHVLKWVAEPERSLKHSWLGYLQSLGCDIVATPNGLLPFRRPDFVHIQDPSTAKQLVAVGPHSFQPAYHIQIPKHIALKILSIGLP